MSFQELGFEVWQTGGGSTAWGKTLPGGRYAMVTDPNGTRLPTDKTLVGVYVDDGESALGCGESVSLTEYPTVAEAVEAVRHELHRLTH
jgi:hypothetical protein